MSIVTRGSIANGLLTDEWKIRIEKKNHYLNYSKEELKELLENIEQEYGSIHPASIAFNLSQPVIASIVIGATNEGTIAEKL